MNPITVTELRHENTVDGEVARQIIDACVEVCLDAGVREEWSLDALRDAVAHLIDGRLVCPVVVNDPDQPPAFVGVGVRKWVNAPFQWNMVEGYDEPENAPS